MPSRCTPRERVFTVSDPQRRRCTLRARDVHPAGVGQTLPLDLVESQLPLPLPAPMRQPFGCHRGGRSHRSAPLWPDDHLRAIHMAVADLPTLGRHRRPRRPRSHRPPTRPASNTRSPTPAPPIQSFAADHHLPPRPANLQPGRGIDASGRQPDSVSPGLRGTLEGRRLASSTACRIAQRPSSAWLRGKPPVGAAGFEPATARPPAGCATRLRHAP
jgi:hypothetical protein